ncbi:glycosyl hydrolase family protein [Sphingobacterium puteale]|uniref:Glycosyl hydrolase family protein n=1 Tax=Sphingobacterium puteale TaxID=2420510 RepID=A0A420VUH6_9SPHI|nr:glycosyl hydrolase family protein [Sphingobacterium puteale]
MYIFLASIQVLSALGLLAQTAKSDIPLQLLGTRSWIRVDLDDNQPNMTGTKVFWAKTNKKPQTTNAILADGARRYYIQQVDPETAYYIWVESATGKSLANGKVHTSKTWQLDDMELGEVQKNPSSRAVPLGMEVYWQDEFNDRLLNRNKWTTNYFSSLNYLNEKSKQEMLQNQLPQPAYTLDGSAINLYVNDTIPKRIFTEGGNQKISSIQTYDWKTNENLLDNSKGGYFEVKVRRNRQGNPKGTNTAFWFDSPGPDIRYYLQEGAEVDGIKGIRPKGQLFEIDVFEYITAQFVIHGHVDTKGVFQRNLATHIAEGYEHVGQWVTHGVLWTPTSVKHYINGDLIKEYDDKNQIYSPNHFMNVFLGTYGSEGGVNMEVDYIRAYNWPLRDGNELPNPDFEGKAGLKPWEGDGTIAEGIGEKGSKALVLAQGKKIEQYIYLDPAQQFNLRYWGRGGSIAVTVDDVKVVSGELSNLKQQTLELGKKGKKQEINFVTGQEINPNKKIVRIAFTNTGKETIYLDNITVKKK